LALNGGEWLALCPNHFTPWIKNPKYPLDWRLGGPQSWYGHGGEEKNIPPLPCQELNPGHSVHSLTSALTKLPWL